MDNPAQPEPWSLDRLVGANVARLRAERGWSLEDTAVRLRATGRPAWRRATVSALEKGRRVVRLDDLAALLEALATDLDELLDDAVVFPVDGPFPGSEEDLRAATAAAGIRMLATTPRRDVLAYGGRARLGPAVIDELRERLASTERAMAERLAKSIGVRPEVVAAAALELYPGSVAPLVAEQERRLEEATGLVKRDHGWVRVATFDRDGDGQMVRTREPEVVEGVDEESMRRVRGHITRGLREELATFIESGDRP